MILDGNRAIVKPGGFALIASYTLHAVELMENPVLDLRAGVPGSFFSAKSYKLEYKPHKSGEPL